MEENKEITFGRVLKVAFTNWKLLIPVTLVVAASAFLGIKFGYNTLKGSYSSTFSYSSADLVQEKYADGSTFYYRNLISYDNLNRIKAKDEKYASIDVDKILDSSGISITANSNEKNGEKTYTVTLGYKFIKNGAVAKSFIKAIAESALEKDADIVENSKYDNTLLLFDEAETFEEQVKYLARQAEFLTTSYDSLKQNSNLPISVTEQATANQEKVSLLIDTSFVKNMNYRITSNGFVLNYDAQEAKNYAISYDILDKEKTTNNKKIEALEEEINSKITAVTAISSLSQQMEALILRNKDIDVELKGLADKIANKGNTDPDFVAAYNAFKADLKLYRDKLADLTVDYKSVIKGAYITDAAVTYEKSSAVTLNGTISTIINVAISLVAGVVVGAVVNLIVDRKKLYE